MGACLEGVGGSGPVGGPGGMAPATTITGARGPRRGDGHYCRKHLGVRFDRPPDRVLTTGPYAFSRNPMYLGHIIFMLGLSLSTGSKLAWAILLANLPWFQSRVLYDEQRLREKFGAEYKAYCRRVRRWL